MGNSSRNLAKARSPADFLASYSDLSKADRTRLFVAAKIISFGTGYDDLDLLHEAILRTLDGSRKILQNQDLVAYLTQTMRSIALSKRGRKKTANSDTSDAPSNLEVLLLEKDTLESMLAIFGDGSVAQSLARRMITGSTRAVQPDQLTEPSKGAFEYRSIFGRVRSPGSRGQVTKKETSTGEQTEGILKNGLTDQQFLEEFAKRGFSEQTRRLVELELTRMKDPRPRWRDEKKPRELQNLTAPAFLKIVWADKLEKGKIRRQLLKQFDSELLKAVDVYMSARKSRNQDAGDAAGITLITSNKTSVSEAGGKRQNKHPQKKTAKTAPRL